jgi:hypothetical protein
MLRTLDQVSSSTRNVRDRAEQGADGLCKVRRHEPAAKLYIERSPFNGTGALSHLGIQVATTEDVLATRDAWTERGLIAREEMQTSCC